jgi:hypothetical protein
MMIRTVLSALLALVCGASAAVGVTHLRNRRWPAGETETVAVLKTEQANVGSRQEEAKPKGKPPPPAATSPAPPKRELVVYEVITLRGEHRGRVLVTADPQERSPDGIKTESMADSHR